MKQFDKNILDVIGNTPIIKLNKVATNVASSIYVKLEYLNPGGSIKDRMGVYLCEQAVKRGDLKPGGTIVESTSGNTGVGIALFAAINHYKCVFVMADKQSQEKIDNLKSYGAKVLVCPTDVDPEDPRSYYSVAANLANLPNSVFLDQYGNMDNGQSHFEIIGPEIYEQTKGEFDTLMAGIGTGGTISGCSRYLKPKMPHLKSVAVDCEGSILKEYHETGKMGTAYSYLVEGIGEDFLPDNVLFNQIDSMVRVGDEESFHMTRRLLQEEGIYAGGSSGSAVVGAIRYAEGLEKPERILVILPDSGNRYASKIYNEAWMQEMGYLKSDTPKDELDLQIDKILGNA
ncbi:MAG: pyridoxal-phosphate dependent enzyme [Flavobacteriales bacterium]|jgi:cystathionine beta-synthase|tara:strand:+ start:1565 stop:2596 length:1032 start_codon:yes stop_codon:yes gene_type:complete